MSLVVNIQVGNEVELIDAHIAYHLALGVEGFVIADMASVDGTSERLERYKSDERFVIRKFELDDLIDASGPKTGQVGRWMLETTQARFAPDWVIRLDADEFLYPRGPLGPILAALEEVPAFVIERRNAIFQSDQPIPALPACQEDLGRFLVVSRPVKTSPAAYALDDSLPLILTEVQPKVLVRSGRVAAYMTGGHGALDARGGRHQTPQAEALLLVHFWFTTPERFSRKARSILEIDTLLSRHPTAMKGWQWSRWAKIVREDDIADEAAIMQEYRRQFPDAAKLEELRRAQSVRRVADHWEE